MAGSSIRANANATLSADAMVVGVRHAVTMIRSLFAMARAGDPLMTAHAMMFPGAP